MVLITVVILLTTLSWVPLTMLAKSTQTKSKKPRIHLFQDMDNQAKLKAQAASPIFRDGRAMRQPVMGTIARGELVSNMTRQLGYTIAQDGEEYVPQYIAGLPEDLDADLLMLQNGKLKFETFCAPATASPATATARSTNAPSTCKTATPSCPGARSGRRPKACINSTPTAG